jgi:hypothetical protein
MEGSYAGIEILTWCCAFVIDVFARCIVGSPKDRSRAGLKVLPSAN